jgi:HlyD family secretion protein
MPAMRMPPKTNHATKGSSQTVWVLREGKPTAIPVTTGVTDGHFTEITSGELQEGTQVISGATVAAP